MTNAHLATYHLTIHSYPVACYASSTARNERTYLMSFQREFLFSHTSSTLFESRWVPNGWELSCPRVKQCTQQPMTLYRTKTTNKKTVD